MFEDNLDFWWDDGDDVLYEFQIMLMEMVMVMVGVVPDNVDCARRQ